MKKYGFIILAVVFIFSSAIFAYAKIIKCEVDSIQGDKVVLDCGSMAPALKTGDKVKVKSSSKKREPLMGC